MGEVFPASFQHSAMCLGMQSTAPVLLPAALTEGMYPAQGRSQLLCVPELPHAAQDGSRGDYLLLIIIDRDTMGRWLSCVPGAWGGGLPGLALIRVRSGRLLGDSRDLC